MTTPQVPEDQRPPDQTEGAGASRQLDHLTKPRLVLRRLAQDRVGQGVDLLFTDVVMPLISGWELASQLKEVQPGLRVLFTSGYSSDPTGNPRVPEQGVAFIEKPFTPTELARKVRALLEKSPEAP